MPNKPFFSKDAYADLERGKGWVEAEEVKEIINFYFISEKLFIWYKICSILRQDDVLKLL